jgi:four helix bundle protein
MNEEGSVERIDLRVRTKQFALRVIRLFCALPKRTEVDVLGKQLLRSGTSVGANFREAYRARSNAEFVCKVGDCLKELEEAC